MKFFTFLSILFFSLAICQQNHLKNHQKFKSQFGEPGSVPEMFAKAIVSSNLHEHSSISISPDYSQFLWTSKFIDNQSGIFPFQVLTIKLDENEVKPEYCEYFDKIGNSYNASFSPDGKRIYFTSSSGVENGDSTFGRGDIWFVEKEENKWSDPKHLGPQINTEKFEGTPYVTKDYTLYFMSHLEGVRGKFGVYYSKYKDGKYLKPVLLPENINSKSLDWTPYIAPDESYLIFSTIRDDGYGAGDLYISFREGENKWSDPVNMGEKINTKFNERFPEVSPDGKYLFFLSDKHQSNPEKEKMNYSEACKEYKKSQNGWCDIYWVKADFIKKLRKK